MRRPGPRGADGIGLHAEHIEAWKESMARQFWGVGIGGGRLSHALNMSLFVGGLCLLGAERLGAAAIPAA
jgi:phenylacetate-CoA ligase